MTTAVPELSRCPRATPSAELRALARDIEMRARQLEPDLPEFVLHWVDGRACPHRFGETLYDGRRVTIFLPVHLPLATAPWIISHETGHALDYARGVPTSEVAADQFAQRILASWRTHPMGYGRFVTVLAPTPCTACGHVIPRGAQYRLAGEEQLHLACVAARVAPTPRNGDAVSTPRRRCLCGGVPMPDPGSGSIISRCLACGRTYFR